MTLFILFFFQSKIFILNVLGILSLVFSGGMNFFLAKRKTVSVKYLVFWSIPILYVIGNMFFHGDQRQLSEFIFYKYEGDFFVSWLIFSLFYLYVKGSNRSDLFLIQYFSYALIAVLLSSIPINIGNQYFLGYFSSHNASAGMLSSLIVVLLVLVLNGVNKLLNLVLVLVLLVLFLWAESRAFLIALFVAVSFLLWSFGYIRFSKKGVVVTVVFIVFIFAALAAFYDRILVALEGDDYNTYTRFYYWSLAWKLFIENPWFGVGFGLYNDYSIANFDNSGLYVVSGYVYGERHAHNIILQLLAETGVVGLVIFACSYVLLVFGRKNKSATGTIVKTLFLLLLVSSMFGLNFFTPSTSLIFYFFVALLWRRYAGS